MSTLDEITKEKHRVSEALARVDAQRDKLSELEAAERVLARYFLNEGHPGTVIEMAEATPVRMRIFDQVREAALNWDGRDSIRMNWPQG
jgi:hypothetical protein